MFLMNLSGIACLLAALTLTSFAPGASGVQDSTPTFKTGVSDVRVEVQVTDPAGEPIRGLMAADFQVTDEDHPQQIVSCDQASERASIVLLMDVSGSMQPYLQTITHNAEEALKVLRPGDRVAIMVYAKTAEMDQDFSDNLAETARRIPPAITGHDVGFTTNINSAVLVATNLIEERADIMNGHAIDPGRRAILIITDNLGMNRLLPDDVVIRELYRAETSLNAIVVGRAIRPGPPKPGAERNPESTPADVYHLAEETGGDVIHAESSEEAFRTMIERIRFRYTLAYRAPQAIPGTFRRIHVDLSPDARRRYPDAVLRARTGYYAAAS
jgi:VWFA-related protein